MNGTVSFALTTRIAVLRFLRDQRRRLKTCYTRAIARARQAGIHSIRIRQSRLPLPRSHRSAMRTASTIRDRPTGLASTDEHWDRSVPAKANKDMDHHCDILRPNQVAPRNGLRVLRQRLPGITPLPNGYVTFSACDNPLGKAPTIGPGGPTVHECCEPARNWEAPPGPVRMADLRGHS